MKDASGDQAAPKQRVRDSGFKGPPGVGGDMRAELWMMLRLISSRLAKTVVERVLHASRVRLYLLVRTLVLQHGRDLSSVFPPFFRICKM